MISQNVINYTVMYDSDHKALNSKTVLLGFDPPIDNNLPDFMDDFSSPNDWDIIKGNWTYNNDGLHGHPLSGLDNIVLSPIVTNDATINTSFKLHSANRTVANYVKIIYGWEDPDNYSSARATFYRDNVYLAFDNIRDGNSTTIPKWPGTIIPTSELSWKPGDLFNMTLSKQGNKEELFLNGTKYLSKQSDANSGYIGLSVDRAKDVCLDHCYIQQMDK